jgi:tRNA splicing endonuclease
MFQLDKKDKFLFLETDEKLRENFSKAGFGLNSEGRLFFHPLEAAYLAQLGKTDFGKLTFEKFMAAQRKSDKLFLFAFAVYSRVRGTGRAVRPYAKETHYFRVYSPGVGREEERPSQLVCLLPGKEPSVASIVDEVKIAHLARLDLIIACGTEKEIKFYKVSAFNY